MTRRDPIRVPSQRGYAYYVYDTTDPQSWRYWQEVYRGACAQLEWLAERTSVLITTIHLLRPKSARAWQAHYAALLDVALDIQWAMAERDWAWQIRCGCGS